VTDFSGFNADIGKECVKKAILAYHPDKQGGPNSSRKWQVLAEEITKVGSQLLTAPGLSMFTLPGACLECAVLA
jgi:hypothetical protein